MHDAHCSISIATDGNGYVHLSWGQHNSKLNYCVSHLPLSLDVGQPLQMLGSLEENVTYPEFYKLPCGDLLFLYKDGSSGNGNLIVNKYSVKNKSWKRLHTNLIAGEGQRNAYWQACVDKSGTVHLAWTWRETSDVTTNHDICYAESHDGGNTWETSSGKHYQLPIRAATAEYICNIPQNSELINQTSINADDNGNAYIATYWKANSDTVVQYRLVYYRADSSKWVTACITARKTVSTLRGGGTKKIPMSRPLVIVRNVADSVQVFIVFRDMERGNKVSVCHSTTRNLSAWHMVDVTQFSAGSWEPTHDADLWKETSKLHLFLQNSGQGDGEQLENLPAQPVSILGITAFLKN